MSSLKVRMQSNALQHRGDNQEIELKGERIIVKERNNNFTVIVHNDEQPDHNIQVRFKKSMLGGPGKIEAYGEYKDYGEHIGGRIRWGTEQGIGSVAYQGSAKSDINDRLSGFVNSDKGDKQITVNDLKKVVRNFLKNK